MSKRAGVTEKISISLRSSELASLRKRAKRLYGGNVSAVVSELAADAALLEGMHELVHRLGGAVLTEDDRESLAEEWTPNRRRPARSRKAKTGT